MIFKKGDKVYSTLHHGTGTVKSQHPTCTDLYYVHFDALGDYLIHDSNLSLLNTKSGIPGAAITATQALNSLNGKTYKEMLNAAVQKKLYGTIRDVARCECGSDAVGSPRHSSYCPKHTIDSQ